MSRTATDLGLMALAFAAGTGIAELAGAVNMGTAMAFGQIAFAITLVWILATR